MNSLKEIRVTDSYLGLNQGVRECQDKEPLYNCTTRIFIDTISDNCGCLPFSIRESHKVMHNLV